MPCIGTSAFNTRYKKLVADDEEILSARIVALVSEYGRYGYRRITAMLRQEGWRVNHKRVERIWRGEGLKVPAKQPKRGRLWLNDGSIVCLRAEFPKHVWNYDFMEDRTHNGVKFRILNVIDEYTRECLAVRVGRSLTHRSVIEVLTELFCKRGVPVHIRSVYGLEFMSKDIGYFESFNGKLRDELLAREIFYSLQEAQVLIEMWRKQYNTIRPHSALGNRPSAPAAIYVQPAQILPAGLTF